MTGTQLAFRKHRDERTIRRVGRFDAVGMGFYAQGPISSAKHAGGAFMKLFNGIIIVAVLGVAAVFLPQNSWAGGVSVGIGIGIPLPAAIYPAPAYYPVTYGYGPPLVYGPPVVVPGGPYHRYYGGPYYRYHKHRHYKGYH
jgi:hypothetical protein